jgi:hypothetical protein
MGEIVNAFLLFDQLFQKLFAKLLQNEQAREELQTC